MHRPLAYLFRSLCAFALLAPLSVITALPASAAHSLAPTTTCNNGVGGGGGKGVICEVTIVNTITATGGSATVKVHECLGSAGAPLSGSCSTTTKILSSPVTQVTQCDGTVEGGGATLRCWVHVTNNFYGVSPGATAATVNECIGSAAGGIPGSNLNCDPIQETSGAAITQCNGSANGLTLVHMNCTATGTMASALSVKVDQCNRSANGGGALVECSTTMENNTLSGTPPPTSTADDVSSPSSDSSPLLPLMLLLALGGFAAAVAVMQRRSVRR